MQSWTQISLAGLGPAPGLERQLERELEGTRAALLEQRVQAPQSLVQHGAGAQEDWTYAHKSERIGEVGVIEQVEGVRAELQVHAFRDRKRPRQREIDLRQPKPAEVVSALAALCSGIRSRERQRIQGLSRRGVGAGDPDRQPGIPVCTWPG